MAKRTCDQHRPSHRYNAFTLVELLVVIGIIALLIGILLPVISRVRRAGYTADSKNWIIQLTGAINRYHDDFRAFPGPINNNNIADLGFTGATAPVNALTTDAPGFDLSVALDTTKITGSENLTLGLLGGLNVSAGKLVYNPAQVGLGPLNLNSANPKRYPPYLDGTNLSWKTNANGKSGHYFDDASAADDTIIPEFVDRFPDAMPILYLRSKLGVDTISSSLTATNNSVITWSGTSYNSTSSPPRVGSYDLSQIYGYTSKPIGLGKTIKPGEYVNATFPNHGIGGTGTVSVTASISKNPPAGLTYQYPYDAFPYFQSPSSPNTARQKDGYILISAGPDRVYGTSDDICSFGDVNP